MDWFVKVFIKSSLCWLGLGVLLGLTMVAVPSAIIYRPAHVHANLLGFVTMMIFGVAYHVLPRFSGRPLHSSRLAILHLYLANAGVAGMVLGFLLRPNLGSPGTALLAAGGTASAAGAFLFIYNIWQTIDASALSATQIQRR